MTAPKPLPIYIDALGPLCRAVHGAPTPTVRGACADSRTVQPGWIFCAIPGARDDGTRYADTAVRQGAVAVVTPRRLELPAGAVQIEVTDPDAAAGRIAETLYDVPGRRLRLVGITGTNGKTTSAYLIRDMLERGGTRTGLIGTVCYEWGQTRIDADRTTPMPFDFQALLRRMLDDGMAAVAIEVSSHALAQGRVGSVPFAAALFTNLTRDHLDYHRTFEAYYEAKKRLFTECLAAEAPAVVNADDRYGARLVEELTRLRPRTRPTGFGTHAGVAARIAQSEFTAAGCRLTLELDGVPHRLRSPLIGPHNVYNVAGAAALALRLGVDPACVVDAAAQCQGAPGRLQPVAGDGITAFVDYAHTDDALENVLRALRRLKPHRLIAVFGCGGDRDRTKRPLMGRVAAAFADRVYVTSDNPRSEDPEAIIAEIRRGIPAAADSRCVTDRRAAIRAAIAAAEPGDIVLVAGKGHEQYQIVGAEKLPFDDVTEVRAAFAARGEGAAR